MSLAKITTLGNRLLRLINYIMNNTNNNNENNNNNVIIIMMIINIMIDSEIQIRRIN
jgi:hypothetical protein